MPIRNEERKRKSGRAYDELLLRLTEFTDRLSISLAVALTTLNFSLGTVKVTCTRRPSAAPSTSQSSSLSSSIIPKSSRVERAVRKPDSCPLLTPQSLAPCFRLNNSADALTDLRGSFPPAVAVGNPITVFLPSIPDARVTVFELSCVAGRLRVTERTRRMPPIHSDALGRAEIVGLLLKRSRKCDDSGSSRRRYSPSACR
jgi:hypothetical protein